MPHYNQLNMTTPTTTVVPVSHLIHTNGIQWEQPIDGPLKINSRDADIGIKVQQVIQDIRSDIMRLRQCHEILMDSKYFAAEYRDKYAKEAELYQTTLEQLKKLGSEPASKQILDALQDIDDQLALNKASVDLLFTKVAYRAGYSHFLMSSVVADIGFEDLKSEANIALKEMGVLSNELQQQSTNDNQLLPAKAALQVFVIFDELCRYEERIKVLKHENNQRASTTNSRVLGVTLAFFALVLGATALMAYYGDASWRAIRQYRIIGVPSGVFLWSLIGSFAAMISQYYKKSVYHFGNTFKWVFIRPVLGVLMAAGIYLALYALVIEERTSRSELLPFLVAFFVGYSDSFSLDLIGSLQNIITSLFSNSGAASSQATKAASSAPIPAPLAVAVPVVTPPPTKVVDKAPNNNTHNTPTHPNTSDGTPLPLPHNTDDYGGEDET